LGLALIKQGHWDAALPEIQAAVDHQPTSAQFHFYLAGVHVRLNQLPQADAEYEKALGIDPEHFQANLLYGRLLLREGHPEAALPKLNRAAKLIPDSAEAHVFLAEAYDKLGQAQNASEERATAARLKAQAAEQTPQEKDPHYKDPQ
jgi:predicted Zn-dependent protease